MSTFKKIDGEYVIVNMNGVFKQVDLAERDGLLYAVTAGGYVQLRADGGTSKDKLRFVELTFEEPLYQTALGKLCRSEAPGSKALEPAKAQLLLAGPA